MVYEPSTARYAQPQIYARCGRSGLLLPRIALGLWHNFGAENDARNARKLVLGAFDRGITHFDLANNYGPPPGSAETTLGSILAQDLSSYRDELIVSTKAGYDMWPGPYGDWGSRKYLLASLDQSLRRLGLEYVDIFYSHRPDPNTPLEETCGALAQAVRAGKALYVGLSNYDPEQTMRAAAILRALGTPCVIHQPKYSMLQRTPEQGLFDVLLKEGIGGIVFSPLGQGLLSSRYLDGVPEDARAARDPRFLKAEQVTGAVQERSRRLNHLAQERGQTLAQMALAWVLRQPAVSSALIGASRVSQIEENLGAVANTQFDEAELAAIDAALVTV